MRKCAVCGKTSRMGGTRKLLRGHYNPTNWSRKYPNLQFGKVDGKRVLMCTSCIKSQTKKKRTKVARKPKLAHK